MSAHSYKLEQWKNKQKVLSPPLYQNVNLLRNDSDYQSVDDLPLPPPPSNSFQLDTNRSNQQMASVKFPPPPSELDMGSCASDINDFIQYGYDNACETKTNNSLYANLGLHFNSVTRDHPYESFQDLSLQNSSELSSRPKASVPTSSISSSTLSGLNTRTGVSNNSRINLNSKIQLSTDTSQSAIYANLNNNNPQLGGTGFKPNSAPIKNYLRVNRCSTNKEGDEVDHLTDLLVKSMENSTEPDFFGMCNKCGEKVVGEGSGCTAMEMVYHIQCFTCFDCHKELRGKSFYAMDSNPFCEECYLNTLEKCCVCEKPILDRILRATGKPYHPICFTCVVCKKCLDGIPFTVDASNQIHCIDDFHKKFAPRCSVCNDPIVPEPGKTETVRVVALDRSFHVSCYKCEDCDLLLSSETEGRGCYPLDDHILCRSCNAKRVQAITVN